MSKPRSRCALAPGGLGATHRVELNDWGLTFTPYVDGELKPEHRLGFRLLEARRGNDVLYTAPLEGGNAPALQEEPVRAGYARPAGAFNGHGASLYKTVQQHLVVWQKSGVVQNYDIHGRLLDSSFTVTKSNDDEQQPDVASNSPDECLP